MTGYLNYLVVVAREAELAAMASRPDPFYEARADRRGPGRFRSATARLMVAVAVRLDNRLQPAPVRAVPCGPGI